MIDATNNSISFKRRQSRLGIASVVIAFALPILLVSFILVGSFLSLDREEWKRANEVNGTFIKTSLTFPIFHLIGLIIGLIGLFSKKTKKVFPIAGIVLNGLLLFIGVAIAVMLIYLLSGAISSPR